MRKNILIICLLGLTSSLFGQSVQWPVISDNTKLYVLSANELSAKAQANSVNPGYSLVLQTFDASEGNYFDRSILPTEEDQKHGARIQTIMAYSNKGAKVNLTTKVTPEGTLKWMPSEGKWKIVSLFMVKAMQKVNEKGYVQDYFSVTALDNYKQFLDSAFRKHSVPKVLSFNSSEVTYGNWSSDLFSAFKTRKGYNLEDYLDVFAGFGNQDEVARVKSDYREVLAGMLLDHFVEPWVSWAHSKKALTRYMAMGSPGNILDLYAVSDIPESHQFVGKAQISADPLMLKFASSAAHVAGKNLIASEIPLKAGDSCKWQIDNLFVSGVNHFYIQDTINLSRDSLRLGKDFRDIATLNKYITRSQSFLQMGKPDNDFVLYFPVYDMWYNPHGTVFPFATDNTDQWLTTSSFYKAAKLLFDKGYTFDYISDSFISRATISSGKVNVGGNSYKAVIVPMCRFIPYETFKSLTELAKNGATVLFVELPVEVPGLVDVQHKNDNFQELTRSLALMPYESKDKIASYGKGKMAISGSLEKMLGYLNLPVNGFSTFNLKYIQRRNDLGYIYFLVNPLQQPVKGWIDLGVEGKSVAIFHSLTGNGVVAQTRMQGGKFQVYLQMEPGESLFLQTFFQKGLRK